MIGTYSQGSINDNKMRQTDNQKSPNIPKMILPVSVVRVINTEGHYLSTQKRAHLLKKKKKKKKIQLYKIHKIVEGKIMN